jgi:hypothetical protein
MGLSPRHPKVGRWNRRPLIASPLLMASGLLLALGTTVAVIGVAPASAATTYPLWTATTAPVGLNSVSPSPDFKAVTCPAAGSCVAVGEYENDAKEDEALIDTQSAGTWTALAAPTGGLVPPVATFGTPVATLNSVSCVAVGNCVAVGSYFDNTTPRQNEFGLIEVLAGGTWTPLAAPTAGLSPAQGTGPAIAALDSVSCASAVSCVATGTYTDGSGDFQGLIETLAGGTWTALSAPLGGLSPADVASTSLGVQLQGVSCPAVGTCVAVGGYVASGGRLGLVETLSAGTWTPTAGPLGGLTPAAVVDEVGVLADLAGVSCPVTGSCVAVGDYEDAAGTQPGLIETLTGGTWAASNSPTTGLGSVTTGVDLDGVSCPASGACTAVGGYVDSTGATQIAAVTLAGGTWTATPISSGALGNDPAPNLSGLSCVAVGSCVADGGYTGSSGGQALIETESSTTTAPGTEGYFETASDGGIFTFNAPYAGSTGGTPLAAPVVGMAEDPCTGGYWEVASDGGIFSFNAPFYGSMGGKPLNKPVVGIAAYRSGSTCGYWEVASDGGIFSFNAPFEGSMGGIPLNKPVVAMAGDPFTGGYWEVASDGGIFSFKAPFQGSEGGTALVKPVVGIAAAG